MDKRSEMEGFASIKVVGVGGSGCSAINRMIASKIRGVEFVSINTDIQALHYSQAHKKINIGKSSGRLIGNNYTTSKCIAGNINSIINHNLIICT